MQDTFLCRKHNSESHNSKITTPEDKRAADCFKKVEKENEIVNTKISFSSNLDIFMLLMTPSNYNVPWQQLVYLVSPLGICIYHGTPRQRHPGQEHWKQQGENRYSLIILGIIVLIQMHFSRWLLGLNFIIFFWTSSYQYLSYLFCSPQTINNL